MKRHDRFEWHEAKAAKNLAKHGVSFDDAAIALADEMYLNFHVESFDAANSDETEDRWITMASDPQQRVVVLRIVWCERFDADGSVTRFISARAATKKERREYAIEIAERIAGS